MHDAAATVFSASNRALRNHAWYPSRRTHFSATHALTISTMAVRSASFVGGSRALCAPSPANSSKSSKTSTEFGLGERWPGKLDEMLDEARFSHSDRHAQLLHEQSLPRRTQQVSLRRGQARARRSRPTDLLHRQRCSRGRGTSCRRPACENHPRTAAAGLARASFREVRIQGCAARVRTAGAADDQGSPTCNTRRRNTSVKCPGTGAGWAIRTDAHGCTPTARSRRVISR